MNVGQSAIAERGWERSNPVAKNKQREEMNSLFKVLPFGMWTPGEPPFVTSRIPCIKKRALPDCSFPKSTLAMLCFGSPAIISVIRDQRTRG
jgi:hypothetical protein